MADDIKVVVKVVGQQDIVKTTKSLKAMENGVKSLSKDLDKGRISEDQYNTGLKELRRTVDSSFSSWQKAKSAVDNYSKAVLQASDAAKQAKIDKEVEKVSASYNRLKASIDPVFAAQQRMKKAHAEIRAALKAEVITRDEAAASLRRYRTALKNGQVAGQALNKGMNRSGVLAQQAGYQFGDFAVQVQSGTNIFVAFGQQATQLVGTFSMLAKSTKMIGLFAGLGVAIPIITGLAAAFMRTKERAKEAEVQLKSTSEMLKELRVSSSDAAKELRVLLGTFKDVADLDTFLKVESIKEEIDRVTLLLESAKKATGQRASGQDALQDKIDLLELEKQELITANEKRTANEKLLEIEKSYRELMGEINEEVQKELDTADEIADKRRESQVAFQDQLIAQSNLLNLLQIEKDLGKDHVTYRSELVAQEKERLQKLLDQKEITESQARDALYLYEETLKVNGELENGANSARNLSAALKEAASAMSSLSSFGAGLDKAIAVAAAKVGALKAGADEAVAGRVAGLRADLEVKLSAKGLRPEAVADLRAEAEGKISTLEGYLTEGSSLRSSKTRSGGSGAGSSSKKSPTEEFKEYLDGLKQQVELEKGLVGLFGEKRAEEEAVIQARQKYGEETVAKQEAELRGTLRQIEADKERQRVLEEARQQQESLANSMASSFGDAFTSVVDGTKSMGDAFRDMAKDIIKQLFEVLVVKRLVGSAEQGKESGLAGLIVKGLASFQADGGAWQGGSQIKAYANGGVVGGPTYFPMAGGKTGLMGEAGPEAIMPLKRGANGKLGVQTDGGSQGNVVVNQSFNFSANGDDSVKKLIAQAAPQIANMTKQSMMNERRRGGQMKATFG